MFNGKVLSSSIKQIYIKFDYFARAPGFEPRSKVLETSILPLNYARRD